MQRCVVVAAVRILLLCPSCRCPPLQPQTYSPLWKLVLPHALPHALPLHCRLPMYCPCTAIVPQVVVHNLPWDCTWQQLKDAFSSCGEIERADVVFDSRGRSRCVGPSPCRARLAVVLLVRVVVGWRCWLPWPVTVYGAGR